MPTLVLIRHASAEAHGLAGDRSRQLTDSGRSEARRMGAVLKRILPAPAIVLCSESVRAQQTWEQLSGGGGYPRAVVQYCPELYLGSSTVILEHLQPLSPQTESAVLIGHNPGLHELTLRLSTNSGRQDVARATRIFPPATVVCFEISGALCTLSADTSELVRFAIPDDHP
ncbi:MAG: histidine phosphatase family protein [Polyangiaceae bacterium]|nr:histidine phosphatase family protein [Polyangiaceae bacterium]